MNTSTTYTLTDFKGRYHSMPNVIMDFLPADDYMVFAQIYAAGKKSLCDGEITVSHRTLIKRTGIGQRKLYKCLEELKTLNLIKPNVKEKSNSIFRINWDEVYEMDRYFSTITYDGECAVRNLCFHKQGVVPFSKLKMEDLSRISSIYKFDRKTEELPAETTVDEIDNNPSTSDACAESVQMNTDEKSNCIHLAQTCSNEYSYPQTVFISDKGVQKNTIVCNESSHYFTKEKGRYVLHVRLSNAETLLAELIDAQMIEVDLISAALGAQMNTDESKGNNQTVSILTKSAQMNTDESKGCIHSEQTYSNEYSLPSSVFIPDKTVFISTNLPYKMNTHINIINKENQGKRSFPIIGGELNERNEKAKRQERIQEGEEGLEDNLERDFKGRDNFSPVEDEKSDNDFPDDLNSCSDTPIEDSKNDWEWEGDFLGNDKGKDYPKKQKDHQTPSKEQGKDSLPPLPNKFEIEQKRIKDWFDSADRTLPAYSLEEFERIMDNPEIYNDEESKFIRLVWDSFAYDENEIDNLVPAVEVKRNLFEAYKEMKEDSDFSLTEEDIKNIFSFDTEEQEGELYCNISPTKLKKLWVSRKPRTSRERRRRTSRNSEERSEMVAYFGIVEELSKKDSDKLTDPEYILCILKKEEEKGTNMYISKAYIEQTVEEWAKKYEVPSETLLNICTFMPLKAEKYHVRADALTVEDIMMFNEDCQQPSEVEKIYLAQKAERDKLKIEEEGEGDDDGDNDENGDDSPAD